MNAMRRNTLQHPRRQAGLSLVELMISVTIAMLITIVMANLFLGSRESYRAIDNSSRIQENARYAQQVLGRTIRVAGFRNDFTQSVETAFGSAANVIQATQGATVAVPLTAAHSDSITVRFRGSGQNSSPAPCVRGAPGCGADGRIADCHGMAIDSNVVAVNRFYINPGANGGLALWCEANGVPLEIVPDVELMQVLFGEPTSADLAVNRFLAPGTVGLDMSRVLSVRIALLHRSSEQVAATNASRSYDLLGTTFSIADSRIRTVTTTSIVLRNRAP